MTEEVISLWNKPCSETYEGFKKLAQNGPQIAFCDTVESNKGGIIVKVTMLDFGYSYTEDIRYQTLNNVIKTVIEVYLVKVRTGF